MLLNYSYENWGIVFNLTDKILRVICNIEDDNRNRYYSIKGEITKVEMIGEYVYIYAKTKKYGDDTLFQLKFEGESCLVGDIFSEDEHLDSFACYDFIDD